MDNLIKDIRYAFRSLIKRPGFVVVAVITLALGIGANTAIFSLVNTVLLRSLPVERPDQIVSIAVRGKDDSMQAFSHPNYVDFRDQNQALAGLLIYRFVPLSMSRSGANERVWGFEVSGNYFDVLGVKAIKGRTFLPEEDRTKLTHPVIVVSYDSWQQRFGGDPDLVGKDLLLNNHQFKVIGIAPEGFKGTEFVYSPEIWVPASMMEWAEPGATWLDNRSSNNFFGVGRLKAGVNARQAEASLNLLALQLAKVYPNDNEGQAIKVVPTGFILPELRDAVVSFTWILMASVALVLLVTCTNLAGLLLARANDRRREIAIRLAMGANRFRLIRQLLTESVLLSLCGGVGGLFLAIWIIRVLLGFKPPIDFPLALDVSIDWRVLIFSLAVSVITGAVFGLAPALQATRPSLLKSLKDNAAQGGASRTRLRSGLVVAQIALSLVVLIAAGLVVRTLQQLQTMNPGFKTQNALMMSFDVGLQGYDQPRGQEFYRRVVERVQSSPGVRSAAITNSIPLGLNYNSNSVYIEGQPAERGANVPTAMTGSVGPRYFETMATPLMQGREFSDQDTSNTEAVAVVNETFIKRLMPFAKSSAEVLNRRFSFTGTGGPFVRIVGVAGDGKYFNIAEEPRSFVWTPMSQNYSSSAILIVRTEGAAEAMLGSVRQEVQTLDPNLPLFDVKTLKEHMRFSLFPARIAATVLGVFALVALLLCAIGIYGITSYAVAQRTREIGIRMALGAQLGDVLKLVLSHGVKLTIMGGVIGLLGAYLVTRAITSVLYGVSATDPLTFILVSLLLVAVALLACYVPARRATKVNPLEALRYE
ncbi:MAG TPA: ABC transporter permease [Pyrinomonadaceae bacterium]|jgi:predicted permease|nr:ABC transporter permease [Pyrinomonadaceae bacterium]